MAAGRVLGTCLAALCCIGAFALPAPAAAGTLTPSPTALVFDPVAVGAEQEKAVELTNSGSDTTIETMTLEAEVPAGQFEIKPASDCNGAVLGATGSCTINVVFHPTAVGEKKARLVVASSAENAPTEVSLEGTGVAPELSLTPSPFDFGSVPLGSKSPERAFAVDNSGSSPATIETVALVGADSGQFKITADTCSQAGLVKGDECVVSLVFAPTSAGEKSATLEVPSEAPGNIATAPISGTGASSPPPAAGATAAAPPPSIAPARPSNAFSFGRVVHNRGRGTASLPVRVPGPGVLLLTGKGIIARKGAGAALVLGGAGAARVAIVPAGRKEARLLRTGRARVTARVTYTPTGGDALTKSKKIRLRRKRR